VFQGPAIALVELESIARGYVVADAMVKKAPVHLRMTEAITPGKFLVLVDGEVADVECAFAEGVAVAGSGLIDKLFLPSASPPLALALRGALPKGPLDSLGLVETYSVASALLAADAALKAAEVRLVKLELARGIGGKGYFAVSGSLDMVEAAVLAGAAAIAPELLIGTEMIPAPHADFAGRWR
jgi:microcompartment protein CcmL/EutN